MNICCAERPSRIVEVKDEIIMLRETLRATADKIDTYTDLVLGPVEQDVAVGNTLTPRPTHGDGEYNAIRNIIADIHSINSRINDSLSRL